jgi:hypothetical protein
MSPLLIYWLFFMQDRKKAYKIEYKFHYFVRIKIQMGHWENFGDLISHYS